MSKISALLLFASVKEILLLKTGIKRMGIRNSKIKKIIKNNFKFLKIKITSQFNLFLLVLEK